MAPGVGGAPWKGDPSGSPEAVPADACGWGRQEALQGPQAKARTGWGALPGGAGSQGRGVQAPLEKGRFRGFQHGCSPGRMTAPHPPKLTPGALGGQRDRTGCLHPTDSRGRRGGGGLPPALGSIPKTSERPFSGAAGQAKMAGGRGEAERAREGREDGRKPPQAHLGSEAPTAACLCCTPTRPAGSPGPAAGTERVGGLCLFRGTGLLRGRGPQTCGAHARPSTYFWGHASPRAAHHPPEAPAKRGHPKPLFWRPLSQPAKTVAGAQRGTGQGPGLTRWLMVSSRQSRLQTTASTGAWGFSTGRQVKARPQSSKAKSRPWGSGDRQGSLGQRAGAESHQAIAL